MRLIVPSFILLAVIFYEMSGGSDFSAPEPPAPVTEARPAIREPIQVTPARAKPPETLVARSQRRAAKPEPAPPQTEPTDEANDSRTASVRSSLSQGLTLMPEADQSGAMRLVSLELGTAGLRPSAPDPDTEATAAPQPDLSVEPAPDLREVTGTRVNMRDGPGTIYPVVARLNIGHDVEVLGDSGTGWLRLRTLPERQLGWISSSLVSKPDQ